MKQIRVFDYEEGRECNIVESYEDYFGDSVVFVEKLDSDRKINFDSELELARNFGNSAGYEEGKKEAESKLIAEFRHREIEVEEELSKIAEDEEEFYTKAFKEGYEEGYEEGLFEANKKIAYDSAEEKQSKLKLLAKAYRLVKLVADREDSEELREVLRVLDETDLISDIFYQNFAILK